MEALAGTRESTGVNSMPPEALIVERNALSVSPRVKADDFYLVVPGHHTDVVALAAFSQNKDFFFAPFSNPIKEGVSPFTAASEMLYGRKGDIILAIRLRKEDKFVGCIRFTDIKTRKEYKKAEISYFLEPSKQHKGLGTQAILRAVDWAIAEKGLTAIEATVDPENTPSIIILKNRLGLKLRRDGFWLPDESKYSDQRGKKRPRLLMAAGKHTILETLTDSRNKNHYSLSTKVDYSSHISAGAATEAGVHAKRMIPPSHSLTLGVPFRRQHFNYPTLKIA